MRQSGFSLVELSIVLVILGLLVGGILGGQSLIRAAELRSVTEGINTYKTAVNLFRDRYFATPGDMTNATDFWGEADPTPATCATTIGTGTETCNGDGDGQIEELASSVSNEMFRFWQQLANAGLIAGSYTGIEGVSGVEQSAVGGVNVPNMKISGVVWNIRYIGVDSDYYPVQNQHNLLMAGQQNATSWPNNEGFRPEELWNIDTKIDDGKPGTGIFGAYGDDWTQCIVTADDPTTDWRLSNSDTDCGFMVIF